MKLKYRLIEKIFNLPFFVKKKNKNTFDVALNKIDYSSNVKELKGLKILFISDIHVEITPTNINSILDQLVNLDYDFCFLGGDYFENPENLNISEFRSLFKHLLDSLNKANTYAILGNHDNNNTEKFIEENGIHTFTNTGKILTYNNYDFFCYGIDYHNPNFEQSYAHSFDFSILLAHDPDTVFNLDVENHKFSFQFSGHTHNGQIQFPKGFIPRKNTSYGQLLLNGLWRAGKVDGVTSSGAGCSTIPIRYNTQSEILLITFI